jgi:hypothetical protein
MRIVPIYAVRPAWAVSLGRQSQTGEGERLHKNLAPSLGEGSLYIL